MFDTWKQKAPPAVRSAWRRCRNRWMDWATRSRPIAADHEALGPGDLCTHSRTVLLRRHPKRVAKCLRCHLAFDIDRRPLDQRPQEYGDAYFQQTTRLQGDLFPDRFPYLICRALFLWGAHAHAFHLPNRRFLDVGCGVGMMMKLMQFFDLEVEGIEQSAWAVDYCRREMGISSVRQGTLPDPFYPSDRFGMLSLIHVLEHLEEPAPVLAEAFRILAPGGLLYGEVPHSERFRADYGCGDHFWFFSIPGLRYLLACTGFRNIRIADGSRDPQMHRVPFLAFRAEKPVGPGAGDLPPTAAGGGRAG